jgi:hypothetical protein
LPHRDRVLLPSTRNPAAVRAAARLRGGASSRESLAHTTSPTPLLMLPVDAELLQRAGCVELPAPPRSWRPVEFCEEMHRAWRDRCIELLSEHRAQWLEDGRRLGTLAAERASAALKAEGAGLHIYAAHPSRAVWEPWEDSGPRFYVSIIRAALQVESGCCSAAACHEAAPPPPRELEELLWPHAEDRAGPRITELGWTLVPPHSDPQRIHADIVAWQRAPDQHPRTRGRYHHVVWRAPPPGGEAAPALCSTEICAAAFTNGVVTPAHHESMRALAAPCVVFDSECLHRGGSTIKQADWSSSCSVQLCSGTGWPALACDGRAEPQSLRFTIPIEAPRKRRDASESAGGGEHGTPARKRGRVAVGE